MLKLGFVYVGAILLSIAVRMGLDVICDVEIERIIVYD